jgi:hypothetical protein
MEVREVQEMTWRERKKGALPLTGKMVGFDAQVTAVSALREPKLAESRRVAWVCYVDVTRH